MSSPRSVQSNSVKDRMTKREMMIRKAKKWAPRVSWALLAVFVVVSAVIAARTVTPGSTVASLRERVGSATGFTGLTVTRIEFTGRQNTPEPLLNAALGVSKGDPILGFSVEQARARIETLPWVEQATVERRLPGSIVVVMRERRPFAIWQNQKKPYLIDRAGKVVADQNFSAFRDRLPVVVGAGAPVAAAALLTELDKYPTLTGRVEASVRIGERRWNLHLKSGTDVLLPEGHEAAALERLMQLQTDFAVLDRPLATIDMRLGDRLVLKPRQDAATEATPVPPRPPGTPPAVTQAVAKKPT